MPGAADLLASGQDLCAPAAVDRAVHAAAAQQRRVGGVDDGVDLLLRDVALHEEQPGLSDLGLVHGLPSAIR
jgi:hypothetical protein